MLRIQRSAERARQAGVPADSKVLGSAHPDQEWMDNARAHQNLLHMVRTYGCGTCCAMLAPSADGSRLLCALLVSQDDPTLHLTEREKDLAEHCKIPDLYEDVFEGKVTELTEAKVLDRVPDFRSAEQKADEKEAGATGKKAERAAKDQGAQLVTEGLLAARPHEAQPGITSEPAKQAKQGQE